MYMVVREFGIFTNTMIVLKKKFIKGVLEFFSEVTLKFEYRSKFWLCLD